MSREMEAWVKESGGEREVYSATADETSREFYDNTFLVCEFENVFSERLRLIEDTLFALVPALRDSSITLEKWKAGNDTYSWSFACPDVITAIKLDSSNRGIIATGNYIKIVSKDGIEELSINTGYKVFDLDIFENGGNLFIVAALGDISSDTGSVAKFDDSGSLLWSYATSYKAYQVLCLSDGMTAFRNRTYRYGRFGILSSSGDRVTMTTTSIYSDGLPVDGAQGGDESDDDVTTTNRLIWNRNFVKDSSGNIYCLQTRLS